MEKNTKEKKKKKTKKKNWRERSKKTSKPPASATREALPCPSYLLLDVRYVPLVLLYDLVCVCV